MFAFRSDTSRAKDILETLSTIDNKPAIVVSLEIERAFELVNALAGLISFLFQTAIHGKLLV